MWMRSSSVMEKYDSMKIHERSRSCLTTSSLLPSLSSTNSCKEKLSHMKVMILRNHPHHIRYQREKNILLIFLHTGRKRTFSTYGHFLNTRRDELYRSGYHSVEKRKIQNFLLRVPQLSNHGSHIDRYYVSQRIGRNVSHCTGNSLMNSVVNAMA